MTSASNVSPRSSSPGHNNSNTYHPISFDGKDSLLRLFLKELAREAAPRASTAIYAAPNALAEASQLFANTCHAGENIALDSAFSSWYQSTVAAGPAVGSSMISFPLSAEQVFSLSAELFARMKDPTLCAKATNLCADVTAVLPNVASATYTSAMQPEQNAVNKIPDHAESWLNSVDFGIADWHRRIYVSSTKPSGGGSSSGRLLDPWLLMLLVEAIRDFSYKPPQELLGSDGSGEGTKNNSDEEKAITTRRLVLATTLRVIFYYHPEELFDFLSELQSIQQHSVWQGSSQKKRNEEEDHDDIMMYTSGKN